MFNGEGTKPKSANTIIIIFKPKQPGMEFVRDTEQQMSIFSSESPQDFLLNSIRLITENRIFTQQEKSYSSAIHSHRDVQHAVVSLPSSLVTC